MKTKPLYLDDSYQQEMQAIVQEVITEGEGKYRVRLNQTIFYPMGGGQATDQGKLTTENWAADVYQVMMKDGNIWHYIQSPTSPESGQQVKGNLNWERRYQNMKKHSAGHIIDFAMYQLGYSPEPLMPYKGDHNKNLHIQYKGTVEEDIKDKLQEKTNQLIQLDLEFTWEFTDYESLKKEAIYLQPYLPKDKPLRIIRLEGVGAVADGGTQVKKTSEVDEVVVDSVETKDGDTIVYYSVH